VPPNKRDKRSALEKMQEALGKQSPTGKSSKTVEDIFAEIQKPPPPNEPPGGPPLAEPPEEPRKETILLFDTLPLLAKVSNEDRAKLAGDEELQRALSDRTLKGVYRPVRNRFKIIADLELRDVIDWDQYHADHPDKYPPK
jgi:hypothetical protein